VYNITCRAPQKGAVGLGVQGPDYYLGTRSNEFVIFEIFIF